MSILLLLFDLLLDAVLVKLLSRVASVNSPNLVFEFNSKEVDLCRVLGKTTSSAGLPSTGLVLPLLLLNMRARALLYSSFLSSTLF